ncbi:hypothetical protein LguiA_027951 [Lonicera macranthoides]
MPSGSTLFKKLDSVQKKLISTQAKIIGSIKLLINLNYIDMNNFFIFDLSLKVHLDLICGEREERWGINPKPSSFTKKESYYSEL